jgi:hypothetical protein
MVNNTENPSACSRAWGMSPRKAAARSVPVAYEIRQGSSIFWILSGNERNAAAVINTPAVPARLNTTIHMRSIVHPPFLTNS